MQRKLCTRKIDELGRIVLPQEARNTLGIKTNQSLDIIVDEDSIIIKTNDVLPVCNLCGESELKLTEVEHSLVCSNCITKIKGL